MPLAAKYLASLRREKPERQEISSVRQTILNRLLHILSLIGFPAVAIGSAQAFSQGRWIFSFIYVFVYLIFLLATFGSRLFSYRMRAIVLVTSMFLIAMAVLFRIGMSGVGSIILVGVCFLASVLFGFRGGIAAIFISLLGLIFVAIGMTTGLIEIYPEHMMTSTSAMAWITLLCVFFGIVCVTVTAPEMFRRTIEQSLDRLEEHQKGLETSNQYLREEIREREWAENALKNSEQKYRSVIENIQDVFYRSDDGGRLLMGSPSGARLFGYGSVDEMIGLPLDDFWPDPNERQELLERIKKHGAAQDFEAVLKRKDGSTFNASFTTHFYYDDAGRVLGTEGIIRDITGLKKAQKEMRESERRYRTLFEMSSDSLFLMQNDRFVDCNPATLKIFQCASKRELLDRSPVDFSPILQPNGEASLSAAATHIQAALSGKPQFFEWEHLRLDGTPFSAEVTLKSIEIDAQIFLLATVRDISERKRAEAEMRRLRKYLENIINSMPSVLVGVDGDGRVSQWNTAAERATGVPAKEACGQMLDQIMPVLGRELNKVKAAIRDRVVKSEAKVPRQVEDRVRYNDITVYPLITNGVEGAVIRVDDVTERVRMEEMIIQSEKMLSVGGLAAGMAHEINNPLGVIVQASQNVMRRVSPDLAANVRAAEGCGTTLQLVRDYLERREIPLFLEDIRKSGLRAAEIVSNMLRFSRKAEDGGSPADLAELLDKTLALAESDYDLKKKYDFRKIQIVREYDPDVPMVVCQPSKLQQVFLNILRNGAEAMHGLGNTATATEVRMNPPKFILRTMKEEEMVRLEIEDNGPGMDEAMRRRIFEPFFTTKPPGTGTGLGLSVSYFIVTEHHGGTLSVESKMGRGSRFIIRLPAGGSDYRGKR